MSTEKQGLLIVIDGTDGTGKQTQTSLLQEHLEKEGYGVHSVSFPRYRMKSAEMAEKYLRGELGGEANKINPYVVSTYFAEDRLASSPDIYKALAKGFVVISDRYVTANVGHQGSKFDNPKDRNDFLKWLFDLEYEKNKIPRPDINFILHIPIAITERLVKERGEKRDIHEKNADHLRRAEAAYLELPKLFSDFILIDCLKQAKLMSPLEIHEIMWSYVSPLLSKNI